MNKNEKKKTIESDDKDNLKKYLYLVAFIEGACVMAVELAGAKMIAPFYGTSLYVWAAVLAVTLGGLTTGYFFGGWASYKYQPQKLLLMILAIGSILISLMPLIALKVMPATHGLGLRLGSLVSSFLIMFLPLICMGMVSPTLIQINNTELKGTGKTAGTIYGVSTVGGILMTLLMGFYLLPNVGIRNSVFLTAFLLALMAVLVFILIKKYKFWASVSMIFLAITFLSSKKPFTDPKVEIKNLYHSEGILGQLVVMQNSKPQNNIPFRVMFINQIPQTYVSIPRMPESLWSYPHRLATYAAIKPPKSKALLVGMGGGSLAMEFDQMGFQTDIVEIDERIPKLADKYFGFKSHDFNIQIADGRHFIKNSMNKYDIVVFDVINGENQPYHLFTKESFSELKNILNDDAIFIINFQGNIFDEFSLAARSIIKTLENSGFNVKYFANNEVGISGDVHFIASLSELNFNNIEDERLNQCCRHYPHSQNDLFNDKLVDLSDGVILVDDKPVLETLNIHYSELWRKNTITSLVDDMGNMKIPFFH